MTTPLDAGKFNLIKTNDFNLLKEKVKGYDFDEGINYEKLLKSSLHTGFQATNFGLAVEEINKMIQCRKEPIPPNSEPHKELSFRPMKNNCTIFLGYTSSIISCGIRETIRFLAKHGMIDCIVTTAGEIEEDFMKCLKPTYLGDFALDGAQLKYSGINRNANLLVPNDNYNAFDCWFGTIFDKMHEEQENGTVWTPSKMIRRLGLEINDPESIYYWCARNDIPVFCPAITDGALGCTICLHSLLKPGFVLDIAADMNELCLLAAKSINSGMISIGAGLPKHHICNANTFRDGADYCVYLNTSSEYDGSDSGARPDKGKSWSKIKPEAKPVKIFAEASLIFPLLVAQTFAKDHYSMRK